MRAALTVEKQVTIAWKLAMPDYYRLVGNRSGVGKSTMGIDVMQVCRAINRLLLHRTVTLGNLQDILDSFAAMGFPNCLRAIDGTHIPILVPDHLATEYINRKGYFSIVYCKRSWITRDVLLTSIRDGQGRCKTRASIRTQDCSESCKQGLSFQTSRLSLGMLKCQ
ncbi:unnamed protein product [Caretta caretta]